LDDFLVREDALVLLADALHGGDDLVRVRPVDAVTSIVHLHAIEGSEALAAEVVAHGSVPPGVRLGGVTPIRVVPGGRARDALVSGGVGTCRAICRARGGRGGGRRGSGGVRGVSEGDGGS